MKRLVVLLILVSLSMSPVLAQDSNTTDVPDGDIGPFPADHPLYIFERASDQIQMTLGMKSPEEVLEKRAAEALDLQERGVGNVSKALSRVESVAERVNSTSTIEDLSTTLGTIATENPDLANKAQGILSGDSETNNSEENIDVLFDSGTVSVSGIYHAPNTGYEVTETVMDVNNSEVTVEFYLEEDESMVHAPVITDVQLSESVDTSMENFDVTVLVYEDGNLEIEKKVE